MNDWLVLTASLPAAPSGLRVRIWRSLKATGCASLRDGVYILPATAPTATEFWAIEAAIRKAGTDAHMLAVQARDAEQQQAFVALFDRTEQYEEFAQSLKDTRKTIKSTTEADLRRALHTLTEQLRSIEAKDFLAGESARRAASGLETLRAEIERHLSPGEPAARAGAIRRLGKETVHGKVWATRKRPWVDRLATAWLVRRFVDPAARFLWLDGPKKCPRSALGFDFDGATFTHVDDKVTFEVVARTFGLDGDAALVRLGELVHFIDVGGIPVDEAAGVEMLVRGLQAQHASDDALLAAALPLFDTLYAALGTSR